MSENFSKLQKYFNIGQPEDQNPPDPFANDGEDDVIDAKANNVDDFMTQVLAYRQEMPEDYAVLLKQASSQSTFKDDFVSYMENPRKTASLKVMRKKDPEHFFSIIRRYEYLLNLLAMRLGIPLVAFLNIDKL